MAVLSQTMLSPASAAGHTQVQEELYWTVSGRRGGRRERSRPRMSSSAAASALAIRRSAASAFGIWRNEAGSSGRQARQPATSQADQPLAGAPRQPVVLAHRRAAAGRPTATASRRTRPAAPLPATAPAARAAAASTTPASSRATGETRTGPPGAEHLREIPPRTRRGRAAAARPARRTPGRSAASPRSTRPGARPTGARATRRRPPSSSRRAWHGPTATARVARRVARPGDPAMERVQPADLRPGRGARSVHDRQVAAQRPGQPAPWVVAEIRMVGDARGDRRVRELEQQRPRTGAQQQHRLAVEPPRLRAGAIEAGVGRRVLDPARRAPAYPRGTISDATEGRPDDPVPRRALAVVRAAPDDPPRDREDTPPRRA